MRPHLLAAVLLLAAGRVMAQDLARCASIDDDAQRLRCYDEISGRVARSAAPPQKTAPRRTDGMSLWEQRLVDDARRAPFALTAYRPSYFLFTHLASINHEPYMSVDPQEQLQDDEIKMHLSMQFKLADDLLGRNGDLWFAYSQSAYWQLFSKDISSPVRESNYQPEAYMSFLTDYRLPGFAWRGVNLGVVHQSNGRSRPLSRSWNRVYAEFQFVSGDLGVSIKPWLRLEESAGKDDNPDIEEYLGNYELRASWEKNDHLFSLMLRNAFDRRYGAELSWSFPISGRLRGLVQWYNGYGESLIDYDHKNNRIGVGILISDWL